LFIGKSKPNIKQLLYNSIVRTQDNSFSYWTNKHVATPSGIYWAVTENSHFISNTPFTVIMYSCIKLIPWQKMYLFKYVYQIQKYFLLLSLAHYCYTWPTYCQLEYNLIPAIGMLAKCPIGVALLSQFFYWSVSASWYIHHYQELNATTNWGQLLIQANMVRPNYFIASYNYCNHKNDY